MGTFLVFSTREQAHQGRDNISSFSCKEKATAYMLQRDAQRVPLSHHGAQFLKYQH